VVWHVSNLPIEYSLYDIIYKSLIRRLLNLEGQAPGQNHKTLNQNIHKIYFVLLCYDRYYENSKVFLSFRP
jgi:hypothetical protein